VQNGEIFNHEALHAELHARGHTFATRCDTEVLVHAYEEFGPGFLERLRGMFAIALWDTRERRLLLARDPFGIKPLLWRVADGVLSFASELTALREQPGFREELDPDALEAYFATNSIPSPLSIYRGVRKLPPGHLLEWRPGSEPEVRRWTRPAPVDAGAVRREDPELLADELRAVLRDSVAAHLVSDVPVGVFLSGGIDSGALAALAAEQVTEPLRTFSVGFEEQTFDERSGARAVATQIGASHHEIVLRAADAAELLPRVVAAYDEPFGDSSMLPTFAVSELAAGHVKVALSGEGGDELFGGYQTYVAALLAPRFGRPARALLPLIERVPSSSRRVSLDYKARRFARAATLDPVERLHGFKEILTPDGGPPARALGRDRGRRAPGPAAGSRRGRLPRRRPVDQVRPRVDGELARGARAVLRRRGRRVRALAADRHEGPALQDQAPAAPGGRPAVAGGRRARPQARVLDPRGRMAAGTAAEPRARRPLARRAALGGPGRPRDRGQAARRARRAPRRPLARAVGAGLLLAVVSDRRGRAQVLVERVAVGDR
jgi:asparagine synthase (glutamine-hydrolysing)